MSLSVIDHLLTEVQAQLEIAGQHTLHGPVLERLTDATRPRTEVPGKMPAHAALLVQALEAIPDHPFGGLKCALNAAKDHLNWKVDDGGFYAPGDDVGAGYRQGNMHSLLLGPANAPLYHADALLGFFLLAPHTLYRDHAHLAPELYIPLTGPSGWRFDQGAWEDAAAGQVIHNPSDRIHAMRVYDVPFLALFAWTRDISHPCRVVSAGDWAQIEAELTQS